MALHWLLPTVDGIPVLMYHRVWPGLRDGLTVTPELLRAHFGFLRDKGYRPLNLQDFLDTAAGKRPRQPSDLLLTFDDGYRNNLTHLYPVLREFAWPATIFVITGTLDGSYPAAATELDRKLTVDDYRQFDPHLVQLALHAYQHENHKHLSADEAGAVARKSIAAFRASGLPFFPVLAYPYGGRPKDAGAKRAMKQALAANGITAAFRIGNKPERVPSRDPYEIKRIDVRGEDDVPQLAIKLRKGKLKPF
jgi:peptidoglycan/xylan/chitin deacetylase (PgdA/CDA1 family)